MRLFSPAKINLFLAVCGRRNDGFHELATLMQAVDHGDWMTFRLGGSDRLRLSDPSLPTDGSNLVLRAVDLFRERTGLSFGVEIDLEKRIPVQGGLGGGSSNAATTLWALNRLLGEPATMDELMSWGVELGSDVPFFFGGGTALCTGRGEVVESVDPITARTVWIAAPPFGLSTPAIFQRVDLSLVTGGDPDSLLRQFRAGERGGFNDLALPAYSAMPQLRELHMALEKSGCGPVVMSGSGSSLICFGAPPPKVEGLSTFAARYIARARNQWYCEETA